MALRISEFSVEHNQCDSLRRLLKKFVQPGRRRVAAGGVPGGYVEDCDEPRTKLEDFFNSLLHLLQPHRPVDFPGLLEFLHMLAEGWTEFGGEDCLAMGLDAPFDLLDGVCQLFASKNRCLKPLLSSACPVQIRVMRWTDIAEPAWPMPASDQLPHHRHLRRRLLLLPMKGQLFLSGNGSLHSLTAPARRVSRRYKIHRYGGGYLSSLADLNPHPLRQPLF